MLGRALYTLILTSVLSLSLAAQETDNSASDNHASGTAVRKKSTEASTSQPTSKPAKPAAKKGPVKEPKYAPATEQQLEKANAFLEEAFEHTKKNIDNRMHKLETPHFIIYSGFDKGSDKMIGDTCEAMYKMLCRQFDVDEDESVYVGKCGIFLFTTSAQFKNFAMEYASFPEEQTEKLSGFCGYRGHASFVAMNAPTDKQWYKVVLVHEGTHAFIWRFISDKHIPAWLNEGIAEYTAVSLVPCARLTGRCKAATKEAIKDGREVKDIFERKEIDSFNYGIAQSWVRFMIASDRKAFIKFVSECKAGTKEEDAFKAVYKMSKDEFIARWKVAAAREMR